MFVNNLAVELGINEQNKVEVLERFVEDPEQCRFADVFPDEENPITFMNIVKTIAAFERGVIARDSFYDQAVAGKVSLNEAEERGRAPFFSEQAQCSGG